jgi:serine protease Do
MRNEIMRPNLKLRVSLSILCFLQLSLAASKENSHQTSGQLHPSASSSLEQLSSSLQSIAKQVEPAVVQVLSSTYAIDNGSEHGGAAVVSPQRSSGTGILISSDGFIVTNAHVVEGARRLRVKLNQALSNAGARPLSAKLIGADRQTDIAVIKIELTGLPFLSFGDSSNLNQGQVVLAFGNPLGLENSVSMGVVSSVDRQLDLDSPLVYVQTDAAINPGNSGGPLVNTAGQVVGMNTFIFSKSGGNEGIGFAIPSNLVSAISGQIRNAHHVHHHQIGISVRAISPALAQALNLATADGVLIEDVALQSAAEDAGLKVGDIIIKVNSKPIHNVRQLAVNMYAYAVGDQAHVDVLRGQQTMSFQVPVVEAADDPQRFADLVTEQDNSIPKLGILGLTVDEKLSALLPSLRDSGGALVAAKMAAGSSYFGDDLLPGDVIHSLNGKSIKDIGSLSSSLDSLKAEDPVVLQVERSDRLLFVVLESD